MLFRKKTAVSTLEGVLESSWKVLHDGVRDFKNPFHHASLATLDGNKPRTRMVIVREFSEKDRLLICHCHVRSSKVSEITDNPNVSWLFYDPKKWLQLRLSGTASVHTDDNTAEAQWGKVRIHHRINYCAKMSPGSPVSQPTAGLPDLLGDKGYKILDGSEARKNFAAIVCRFDEMDWLLLKLTGHIRAKFHWKDDRMDASWVIP